VVCSIASVATLANGGGDLLLLKIGIVKFEEMNDYEKINDTSMMLAAGFECEYKSANDWCLKCLRLVLVQGRKVYAPRMGEQGVYISARWEFANRSCYY
jgi:hypothetical protein